MASGLILRPSSAPVDAPGFYDMEAARYHADPCPAPSLNHSVARVLLEQSPAHARLVHPRYGGATSPSTREGVIGDAAHALLLGRGKALAVLNYDEFRSKEAKQARAAAFAQGFTPIRCCDYDLACAMAEAARPTLASVTGEAWRPEVVAIAHPKPTWLRTMIDALSNDLRLIVDYKTVESAEPEACAAKVRQYYATQQAFITHVLDLLDPENIGRRRFLFMFQERVPPYAITWCEAEPALVELAEKQIARAVLKWALCTSLNKWPAYPPGPHLVAPKPWDLNAELDRQYAEATAPPYPELANLSAVTPFGRDAYEARIAAAVMAQQNARDYD